MHYDIITCDDDDDVCLFLGLQILGSCKKWSFYGLFCFCFCVQRTHDTRVRWTFFLFCRKWEEMGEQERERERESRPKKPKFINYNSSATSSSLAFLIVALKVFAY